MITRHLFGRSIYFRFRPIADDQDVPAYSLETARIYADEPTAAQKINTDTSGAIGSDVITWTEKNRGEYQIVFPALPDSNPESSADYESYYINVRLRYEAAGPIGYKTEVIWVYRPDFLTSSANVKPHNIIARESKFADLAPYITWIDDKIADAEREVDRILHVKGYHRQRTFNRERLNESIELLATANGCLDLSGQGNEFWAKKYDIWKARFEGAMASVPIGIDIDDDDRPSPDEQASAGGAVWFSR